MKLRRLLIFYEISALVASIMIVANMHRVSEYKYIALLPLLFFVGTILIYIVDRPMKKGRLTVFIFVSIQWLRTVMQPLIGSVSGYFEDLDVSIDSNYVGPAVALLIFETVCTFAIANFIYHFLGTREKVVLQKSQLRGNFTIYRIFIAVAVVLFLATGADTFQFFALSTNSDRYSTTQGDGGSGIEAIITYGLTFLVILIIHTCSVKYRQTGRKRYMYYALLCAALRLCLISSESRLAQVYILGAFLLLLPQLFSEYKKQIMRFIGVVAVLVLSFLTVYKVFYAFNYDSYLDAIKASTFDLADLSSQIDVYFYGVKTTARNIAYCAQSELGLTQPVIDILRNTFGLHYLLPNVTTTVNDYNLHIYYGQQASGHLFSSLAYGYLYFGPLLAPICTCFNLAISFSIEKMLKRIRHTDVYYIGCLIYMRCVVMIFANFPQTFNYISRTLVISFLVIGCSSIFMKRSGKL